MLWACRELEFPIFPGSEVERLAPLSVVAVGTAGIAHPDLVKVRTYDRIEWMAREASRSIPRR